MHLFTKSDRVLMVVSDAMIYGSARIQRYGFLLHKQHGSEMISIANRKPVLQFYDDWEPFWHGPFSRSLNHDIRTCLMDGLMYKDPAGPGQDSYRYGLTISGRVQWWNMLHEFDEMVPIRKKVAKLQKVRLERLLEWVYNAYPESTRRSSTRSRP